MIIYQESGLSQIFQSFYKIYDYSIEIHWRTEWNGTKGKGEEGNWGGWVVLQNIERNALTIMRSQYVSLRGKTLLLLMVEDIEEGITVRRRKRIQSILLAKCWLVSPLEQYHHNTISEKNQFTINKVTSIVTGMEN